MTTEMMRAAITDVYPGPTWRLRVQQMEDRQVIAVYKRMKEENIFERAAKAQRKKARMREQGVQMTIWDFMKDDHKKESEETDKNG